jgi:hypothetical protein
MKDRLVVVVIGSHSGRRHVCYPAITFSEAALEALDSLAARMNHNASIVLNLNLFDYKDFLREMEDILV